MPGSEIYNECVQNRPEYKKLSSFSDLIKAEKSMTDAVGVNLSKVPYLDLKVVHHYSQWVDFAGKSSVSDDSYGVIKKMARDTFDRIFNHGIIGFFYGTYSSVKQFLTVFFYSHFFPSILKKYNLK